MPCQYDKKILFIQLKKIDDSIDKKFWVFLLLFRKNGQNDFDWLAAARSTQFLNQ
jgi:hypothetical protein